MYKKTLALAALSVLVIVVGAACSATAPTAVAPSNQQPAAVLPPPAAATTNQPAVSALAPVCQSATSCQAPIAVTYEIDCTKKVPYTNVLVPPGTTAEVMDKSGNFTCLDSNQVVNGKKIIACHGTQLYSFDLKLTNPACGGANLTAGTGQCQDGFGYDAGQKCCAPLSGASAGSTTVTVNLGACPLPPPAAP